MGNKLMRQAKDTVKLGIMSNVGLGAVGSIGGIKGMPAQASNITSLTGSSLRLANIGNLANIGMGIVNPFKQKKKYR